MSAELKRRKLQTTRSGRTFLLLLSGLFRTGVAIRNFLYNIRLLPIRKLKARVICIGNLTTGGTGKTPAVLLAAVTLRKNQIKTAILTRGYKRPSGGKGVQVLLNSKTAPWQEAGDEPWMMHRALKGFEVPILVHPDRVAAGRSAINYYNPDVLLLDDGFQHRRLHRDLDVVLINALDPFGGGSLLPAGNLREPLKALRRAGLAVITHADQVTEQELSSIREQISGIQPGLEILESAHRPDFLFDLKDDKRRRLAYLKNKPIGCFSAIGDPKSFEDLLRRTGARLVQTWRFPDHHPFSRDELRSINNIRDGRPIVTTLKDFPRLPSGWQDILEGEVLALSVRLEITKGKKVWEDTICDGKNIPEAD